MWRKITERLNITFETNLINASTLENMFGGTDL